MHIIMWYVRTYAVTDTLHYVYTYESMMYVRTYMKVRICDWLCKPAMYVRICTSAQI